MPPPVVTTNLQSASYPTGDYRIDWWQMVPSMKYEAQTPPIPPQNPPMALQKNQPVKTAATTAKPATFLRFHPATTNKPVDFVVIVMKPNWQGVNEATVLVGTTDFTQPVTQWRRVATNNVTDDQGNVNFTNAVDHGTNQFNRAYNILYTP